MESQTVSQPAAPASPSKFQLYMQLARPFTLLPPLLGIVSGAICAFGSAHNPDPARRVTWAVILTIAVGSLCASAMNAASNIVNQIADLEIDRRNKPDRPLVTGEVPIEMQGRGTRAHTGPVRRLDLGAIDRKPFDDS